MSGAALDLISSPRLVAPIGGQPRRDAVTGTGRWTNPTNNQGTEVDTHAHTRFRTPLCLAAQEIDDLIEFCAMANRIVNREPDDAIREGFSLGTPGAKPGEVDELDPGLVDPLVQELTRLDALGRIADARRWGRAYGGGAVVIIADDGDVPPWEPIDLANLRRVRELVAVDREDLYPETSDAARMGRPTHYRFSGSLQSLRLHATRVIPFIGTNLPLRVREYRQFWGGSVLDLVWAELRNWATSHEHGAEAVGLLTQGVFKTKNLMASIDRGDTAAVVDRLEALRIGMGILGDINIDADEEDYQILARPVSGLGEVLDKITSALVAATDMPRSILLGETPGGLNAGENAGEIRSWYDHVRVKQSQIYGPALKRILSLVIAAREGPADPGIPLVPVFPSLWQEDEQTKVANRKSRAEARKADVDAFIVSADEARHDPDLAETYGLDADDPAPEKPAAPGGFGNSADGDDEVVDDADLVATPLDALQPGEIPVSGKDAARLLGFASTSPIRSMHAAGKIQGFRVGNRWRYSWSQIAAAVRGGPEE